jgi:hypothetical protein
MHLKINNFKWLDYFTNSIPTAACASDNIGDLTLQLKKNLIIACNSRHRQLVSISFEELFKLSAASADI